MNKRRIEVFTAGCQLCAPVVEMVKSMACSSCEVVEYQLSKEGTSEEVLAKVREYGVKRLPAVAVNGRLLDTSSSTAITQEDLVKAGVGQSL